MTLTLTLTLNLCFLMGHSTPLQHQDLCSITQPTIQLVVDHTDLSKIPDIFQLGMDPENDRVVDSD